MAERFLILVFPSSMIAVVHYDLQVCELDTVQRHPLVPNFLFYRDTEKVVDVVFLLDYLEIHTTTLR